MLKIIILRRGLKLALVALMVLGAFNCSGTKKADDELTKMAASVNEKCPLKISDDTQLDSVYSLPGRTMVYRYTIFLMQDAAFDKKDFEAGRKKFLADGIKASYDMAYLRSLETRFAYEYYDQDKKLLSKIEVLPADYK